MKDCVFCQIVDERKGAHKVYEDGKFVAFLDNRPLTKGNCLVIPRKHYKWVDDVPEFGEYFEAARRVSKAIRRSLNSDWTQYLTIGHEIPHAHIRVIPRYKRDLHGPVPTLVKIEDFSQEQMGRIASKIRNATTIDGQVLS
jgi:histidine triad (HIT) family protein